VTLGIQQKPSKSRPNRIRKPRLHADAACSSLLLEYAHSHRLD